MAGRHGRSRARRNSSSVARPAPRSTAASWPGPAGSPRGRGGAGRSRADQSGDPAARSRLRHGRRLQDHRLHQRPRLSRRRLSDDRPASSAASIRSRPASSSPGSRDRTSCSRSTPRCCASKADRMCACAAIIRTRCAMASPSRRSTATSAWRCAPAATWFCAARPARDLNEVMHGAGDAAAQAEQAMENVAGPARRGGREDQRCHQGDACSSPTARSWPA